MKKTKNKWFTLIELIVVIIILIILGTIAYISLSNYSKTSRDSSRVTDIKNIKTSLELFSLKTWQYPLPDDWIEVSYSWELLRTQWFVWDNVFQNINENLNKKPIDPLFWIEYVYSITNKKTEYEIMWLFEQELSLNNTDLIFEKVEALANYYTKIDWTYNWLFIMTQSFLFPTPSIINWNIYDDTDFKSDTSLLSSQIVTWGDNIPDLNISQIRSVTWTLDINLVVWASVNKDSNGEEKIDAIKIIQEVFSWSTFDNYDLYNLVLTRESDEEKLELASWIFDWDFNIPSEIYEEEEDIEWPIISNQLPSWIVISSSVEISVVTNEASNCKYDIIDTDYASMLNSFNSNNTTHTGILVLETIDTTYDIYVRCKDLSDNESQTSNIHFTYTNTDEVEVWFESVDWETYTCKACY